jgi:hypothetical protein
MADGSQRVGGGIGYACSLIALLVLVLVTMSGCTGQPEKSNAAPPEDYPTLQGRFAEDPVREPLVAREAFVGDRNSSCGMRVQMARSTLVATGPTGSTFASSNRAQRVPTADPTSCRWITSSASPGKTFRSRPSSRLC